MIRKFSAGIMLLAISFGCSKQVRSPQVAAKVNGKDIQRTDVDRYFTVRMEEARQKPTGDAARALKLEILRNLIEREIMGQEAERLKLQPKDSEIDAQIQQMRGSTSPEEFRKDLERRGFNEPQMRNEVRQTLMMQKVVQERVNSKIHISDADVKQFYEDNKDSFNVKEPQLHIAQIVVTSNASVPVANSKNDKALNEDQAVAKIQRLSKQLQSGEDFQKLASEYSEDSQSAPNGGDLGFQPLSALERLGPPLMQNLSKMQVGDVTPVIHAPQSYLILKLLGRREAGQQELQNPEVSAGIRKELQDRKQQLLSAALAEQLHNSAHVENFMAQEIVAEFQTGK